MTDAPERIYNVDEKGLQQGHTPPSIVAAQNGNAPPAVVSGRGSTVTVIGCGNALGHHIPPYFVFPGQRLRQELMDGSTPGATASVSDSGWSNSSIFQKYLETHFMRYAQGRADDETLLLLYDGHRSHIPLPLIDWAKQRNIILFVLPPQTSHVLQPLDVGCFGTFKNLQPYLP